MTLIAPALPPSLEVSLAKKNSGDFGVANGAFTEDPVLFAPTIESPTWEPELMARIREECHEPLETPASENSPELSLGGSEPVTDPDASFCAFSKKDLEWSLDSEGKLQWSLKSIRNIGHEKSTVNDMIEPGKKAGSSNSLPRDGEWTHVMMLDSLISHKQVQQNRYFFLPRQQRLYVSWKFNEEMVGHKGIVHGGATSFAFDDSFGVLFFLVFGVPAFTAKLNVDFRKPFLASQHGCMRLSVERREGRKVFMKAEMRDGPSGVLLSEAEALFVIAKK